MTSLWGWQRLKSPASPLFTQPCIRTQIKENIKAPCHWPLCRKFTRDRWIPRTNGQLHGKCLHLMTSSWDNGLVHVWWQANIWSNDDLLSIKPVGANYDRILIETQKFLSTKMKQEISSIYCHPISSSLNGWAKSHPTGISAYHVIQWCLCTLEV